MTNEVGRSERVSSGARSAGDEPLSPLLHRAPAVLSLRHAPSWMLLTLAAGAVNAGAFMVCERFVSHVTGVVSRIGIDGGAWALVMEYMLVLLCFIGGAMTSVLAIQARVLRKKRPLHALPLFVVAAILAAVGFAGHMDAFGPMGGPVEEVTDFAFLCVLAFAMGLMNASVASSTALSVRTTHMTGPATDFGVHLATAWLTTGEERKSALQLAALRGGTVVSFCMGAVLMVPTIQRLGFLAFAVPSVLVLVATIRSFTPRRDADVRNTALSTAP